MREEEPMLPMELPTEISDVFMTLWSVLAPVFVGALALLAVIYILGKLVLEVGYRILVRTSPYFVQLAQWRREQKSKKQ